MKGRKKKTHIYTTCSVSVSVATYLLIRDDVKIQFLWFSKCERKLIFFRFLFHFQGLLLSHWGLPCYNGAHWWRGIKKKKIKTKKIQFLFLSHNLTLFFRNYFSNQLLQNPQNEVKQQKSLVSCCNIYFVVFYMLLCVCSKLYAPQIPQKT